MARKFNSGDIFRLVGAGDHENGIVAIKELHPSGILVVKLREVSNPDAPIFLAKPDMLCEIVKVLKDLKEDAGLNGELVSVVKSCTSTEDKVARLECRLLRSGRLIKVRPSNLGVWRAPPSAPKLPPTKPPGPIQHKISLPRAVVDN